MRVQRESTQRRCRLYSPNEGVDLGRLDIVQLLDGIFDLTLVRFDVDNEHQCVVLLDLLHRRLGVQRSVRKCCVG